MTENSENPVTGVIAEPERPLPANDSRMGWVSDVVAEMLRRMDIPYIAMVPGSSYRGLQDSLVNYLGNTRPQMLVCLHEEHAVAIAHGYAKVTEKPMAAAVHANVGLMHATMGVFNAWCERLPLLLLGATGPVNSVRRRAWIDWIHTARDQASMIRGFTKWDAQLASVEDSLEALARARKITSQKPMGPVYVVFDVALQETALERDPVLPDLARYRPAPDPATPAESLAEAVRLLRGAARPVILAGRVSRAVDDWDRRVRLAEALGARVITDLKLSAAFPQNHPLHGGPAAYRLSEADARIVREADVILSLDWLDLGGTLNQAFGDTVVSARVISATLDDQLTNGETFDHHALPPVDLAIQATPDTVTAALLPELSRGSRKNYDRVPLPVAAIPESGKFGLRALAGAVVRVSANRNVALIRLPLGWPAQFTKIEHPLDHLGYDGGAGVGSGPGIAVGAALALAGSGRLPVAIIGDGDYVMGASALWTAAHYKIPLLVVIANNRSYYNDEAHQETMARNRGRPIANRWIGQRLDDPPIDLSGLAQSMGLEALPQIEDAADLVSGLEAAFARVASGASCVLDVRVTPGYETTVAG
ncbi:MAG: thiamine pyrophosphate-binding protein [Proteobacteria bacterium]|nr:thiamine pyrophosphate-binding protein [Pseudomonadota bacterium]